MFKRPPFSKKAVDDLLKEISSLATSDVLPPPSSNETQRNLLQFKKSSDTVIFPKEIFNRGSAMALSPLIFTKKVPNLKLVKNSSPFLISFENYLALIVQMYYKSSFYITENVLNFVNFEKKDKKNEKKQQTGDSSKAQEATEPTDTPSKLDDFELEVDEPAKPGRKKKKRRGPISKQELQNKLEEKEEKERLRAEQKNNEYEPEITSNIDTLDYLVSPLKSDYNYEKWSPKETAIFECGICKFGKEFDFIQKMVRTKSLKEVISFYHEWKMSSHYKIWRHHKKTLTRLNYNSWL